MIWNLIYGKKKFLGRFSFQFLVQLCKWHLSYKNEKLFLFPDDIPNFLSVDLFLVLLHHKKLISNGKYIEYINILNCLFWRQEFFKVFAKFVKKLIMLLIIWNKFTANEESWKNPLLVELWFNAVNETFMKMIISIQ